MAKRIFWALLLVMPAAGGAFAQAKLSAGFGGNFAVSFVQTTTPAIYGDFEYSEYSVTTSGGGFYVFFDAAYVEVDIGMLFGSQKMKTSVAGASATTDGPDVTYLTLGLYGKYPIDLGGFTLFPMLGVQYDIGLSAKQTVGGITVEANSQDLPDALNKLWIKLGVGADFNLSDAVYFRPSALYGINFGTKHENNAVKGLVKDAYGRTYAAIAFYHGLDIRVALGFKF
jgi:hypothetical protein